MIMKKILAVLFLFAVFAALGNAEETKLSLGKNEIVMKAGDVYFLDATLTGGIDGKIEWFSTDASVALVSDGVIEAKNSGVCSVIARYNNSEAQCRVKVVYTDLDVAKATVSDGSVAKTFSVRPPISCGNKNKPFVVYKGSEGLNLETGFALPDKTGIFFRYNCPCDGCGQYFNVSNYEKTMYVGDEFILHTPIINDQQDPCGDYGVTVLRSLPITPCYPNIIFQDKVTVDGEIFTVKYIPDYEIRIKAHNPGTVYVYLWTFHIGCENFNGIPLSAACKITVKEKEIEDITIVDKENMSLSKRNIDLYSGQTKQLYAEIKPEDATNKTVIWKSDNHSVADVDNNGLVTVKGAGKAKITVSSEDGKKSDYCNIQVYDTYFLEKKGSNYFPWDENFETGKKYLLTPGYKKGSVYYAFKKEDHHWTWSANSKCVNISEDGKLTVNKEGFPTVTAKSNDGIVIDEVYVCVQKQNYIIKISSFKKINKEDNSYTMNTLGAYLTVYRVEDEKEVKVDSDYFDWEFSNDCIRNMWPQNHINYTEIFAESLGTTEVTVSGRDNSNNVDFSASIKIKVEELPLVIKEKLAAELSIPVVGFGELVNYVIGELLPPIEVRYYISVSGRAIGSNLQLAACRYTLGVHRGVKYPFETEENNIIWSVSPSDSFTKVESDGRLVINGYKNGSEMITVTATKGRGPIRGTRQILICKEVPNIKIVHGRSDYNQEGDFTLTVDEGAMLNALPDKLFNNFSKGDQYVPATYSVHSLEDNQRCEDVVKWDDGKKILTAKAPGVVRITATADADPSKKASVTVKIVPKPVKTGIGQKKVSVSKEISAESIKLSQSAIKLKQGMSASLMAEVFPLNATDKSVYWSSDNPKAVTVNNDGTVLGVGSGSAVITVRTGNNKTATCRVTVE